MKREKELARDWGAEIVEKYGIEAVNDVINGWLATVKAGASVTCFSVKQRGDYLNDDSKTVRYAKGTVEKDTKFALRGIRSGVRHKCIFVLSPTVSPSESMTFSKKTIEPDDLAIEITAYDAPVILGGAEFSDIMANIEERLEQSLDPRFEDDVDELPMAETEQPGFGAW